MRRRIQFRLIQLLLLAILFALPGCSTKYHEPSAAHGRVAFIEATAPVWIVSIDGKAVSRLSFTGNKRFAVSPGHHTVELQYFSKERIKVEDWYGESRTAFVSQASGENVLLPFTADAGKNYYAHDGKMDNRWKPFISESNAPVFLDVPRP